MSWLNSIMGRNAAAPAPTTPAQPAPAHAAPPAVATNTHTDPSTAPAAEPAKPAEAPTGVAALEQLFSAQQTGEDKAPTMSLTPELMGKVTESVNFMAGVTEDMLAQVSAGDTKALLAVIQQVGVNSYQQAMMHGAELNSQFSSTRADYAAAQAAKGIRGHVIESQVDVSTLSPAAQGMFKQVAARVAESNPTANATQVQAQAMALMQEMANEFNYDAKRQEAAKPVETDWSAIYK